MAFISIMAYNEGNTIRWRMASVRPAAQVREGIYVWERRGDITIDPPLPQTSRAMVQAVIDELQRVLGERQNLGGGGS